MKIFITGATGFIGRHFAKRMADSGHEIICGGRSPARLNSFPKIYNPVRIYLEHKETISRVLKKEHPDIVCHAAALVESNSLEKLRRVNVEGTRNVFDACMEAGIKKVIYLSTVAVATGNPVNPLTEDLPYSATNAYGQSKLEAEQLALEYRKKGLKIAVIRPCMVYGEDEPHALGMLVSAVEKRLIPIFGKGKARRHLVSIENVVDVMALSLSREEAYEGSFFIADKEILTVGELIRYMAKVLGTKPPIVLPETLGKILAKTPVVKKIVSFLFRDRVFSIDRLREKLGYVPRVSVYDGFKRAVLALKK